MFLIETIRCLLPTLRQKYEKSASGPNPSAAPVRLDHRSKLYEI